MCFVIFKDVIKSPYNSFALFTTYRQFNVCLFLETHLRKNKRIRDTPFRDFLFFLFHSVIFVERLTYRPINYLLFQPHTSIKRSISYLQPLDQCHSFLFASLVVSTSMLIRIVIDMVILIN